MKLIVQLIMLIVMILISVAFFSLFERKLLSLIQIRKGPSKVGFFGIMQPFSDAMKLISKVDSNPSKSSKLLYFMSPVIFMIFSLLGWVCFPLKMLNFSSSTLFLVFYLNLSVYGLISLGWFSNSKFASIGAIRSIAQSISYEIILSFSLLLTMILSLSTDFFDLKDFQSLSWLMMSILPIAGVFFMASLAETNRSPFDLSEGESELVSGFCIEYGCISYTLIFLTENMALLMMSLLFTILFMNGTNYVLIKLMIVVFSFVWIRGTMPRIRVDKMMEMCWVMVLPLVTSLILTYSLMV